MADNRAESNRIQECADTMGAFAAMGRDRLYVIALDRKKLQIVGGGKCLHGTIIEILTSIPKKYGYSRTKHRRFCAFKLI